MVLPDELPSTVQAALRRLARTIDRAAPTVFAGRESEIDLLDAAVDGVQRGESGHTVVIQGVPGAGKTALLGEYAARLMTAGNKADRPVVPVPLRPSNLDAPPMAIIQEIDRQFCEFKATGIWGESMNKAIGGVGMVASALFAAFTKRNFSEFKATAKAPNSLPVAFDDYVSFRFDRRDSTIVLLVDEAQNLNDTAHVRGHLDALHGGVHGHAKALLACFGLENTTNRLRELGLSRLASGYSRTIGTLSKNEAKQVVAGTLETVFADFSFDGGELQRSRWIEDAASTIVAESGNFPHHLTNGCRALAEIVLDEGVGPEAPKEKLKDQCKQYKREYYDARLQPWAEHTVALAHAFGSDGSERDGWTRVEDVTATLMMSDDYGEQVGRDTAKTVLKELCANGYVVRRMTHCRPALPSLTSHLEDLQREVDPCSLAMQAIRSGLSARADGERDHRDWMDRT